MKRTRPPRVRDKLIGQLDSTFDKNRTKPPDDKAATTPLRKRSMSLLNPDATAIISLMDLTQQDYEVNAPVISSSLLQGEDLLNALEITENI